MTDRAQTQENQAESLLKDNSKSSEGGIGNFLQNLYSSNDDKLADSKNGSNKPNSDASGTLPNVIVGEKESNKNSQDSTPLGSARPRNEQNKHTDKSGRINDQLSNLLERKKHRLEFIENKEGLQTLGTGDKLVKAGGMEVLLMPNGDTLVAKADGSLDLKSKSEVNIKTGKDGSTTLTYPNGDSITVRDGQIAEVSRGNVTAIQNPKLRPFVEREGRPIPWEGLKPNLLEKWENMMVLY